MIRNTGPGMVDVVEGVFDELANVAVLYPVEDLGALTSGAH